MAIPEVREEILHRLAQALFTAGLSQKRFAETMGVKQATVSRWMNGQNQPSWEMLAAICDRLEISADWLLGREDAGAPGTAAADRKQSEEARELIAKLEGLTEEVAPALDRLKQAARLSEAIASIEARIAALEAKRKAK